MAEDMKRRTQLRDALCDKVGIEVADMLVDYMPSAAWAENISGQFDLINQKFEFIDERFDEINRKFELIDQRFKLIDRRLDLINSRLDRLSEDMKKLSDSMETWSRWMMGTVLGSWTAAITCVAAVLLSR